MCSEHLDFSSVVMMTNGIPIGALAAEQDIRYPAREPGIGKIQYSTISLWTFSIHYYKVPVSLLCQLNCISEIILLPSQQNQD